MANSFYDKKNMIKNMSVGSGIKKLLNEAYEILGNPVMMFDTSYTLLAHTDSVLDDWVWNEIKAIGTFTHETVDFFKQEKFIDAFAVSETVAYMESKHLKYPRYNGKLFDKDNVQLGNISVIAGNKPFEKEDPELIELICEVLSVELQNSDVYKKIDRVYQESLINQIISGSIDENEIDSRMLSKLYKGLKTNLYIAVVDITQYDATNTHLAYFRDLFRKLQKEYEYHIHLNNVVIIISIDDEILNVKKDLCNLYGFFKKYNIYVGISSRFQNFAALNKYFREAIIALNYGLDSKKEQNIFCYDDVRIEHFLYSVVEDTTQILSPVIPLIQKYDKKNNTGLLDTLYVHLLYGLNPLATCEKIGITKDELTHRLKVLEEVFTVDWANGEMLVNLFISLKFIFKCS